MDQQLKTRLIGVTIIVSLVVIFVPMLFEDSSEHDGSGMGSTATAPEFPQAFESQTLPLPLAQSQLNTVPPGTKGEGSSTSMRDEPLDPLDIPPAGAGNQTDEIDAHDTSADAQDALLPERAPTRGSEPRQPVEPGDDFAPPSKFKAGTTTPPDKLKPTLAVPNKPVASLTKPLPIEKPSSLPPAATATTKLPPSGTDLHAPKSKEHSAVKMSAWVVQAGSFADEANAKSVLVKLRQAKINAYVEMIPGPNGNSYRVRVGPELDRPKAETVLKKMETEAGVKGMIVSYP